MNASPPPLIEIVVAGGPCAGKTTVMPIMAEALREDGYRVFALPEMATLIYSTGLPDVEQIAQHNRPAYIAAQRAMLMGLQDLRRHWRRVSQELREPCVLLTDRGELDAAVYLQPHEMQQMLDEEHIDWDDLTTSSYGVVYLRSGIEVVPGHIRSNDSRREQTVDDVRTACAKSLAVWQCHPNLIVVEPELNLVAKIEAAVAAARQMAATALMPAQRTSA